MARHGGGPVGSAARDATASPYLNPKHASYDEWADRILDWPAPDDPPRCSSCAHYLADDCGCTCCDWTCDERPADV